MPNFKEFAHLLNAAGGGGDFGQAMPVSDADDFASGARWVPFEVTDARRLGQKVTFDAHAHKWTMPDGRVID
jgi:hypothetical protein